MEVQVENAEGLRRQLRVRIPAERVERAMGDQLKKIAARAKIPGFRPGKAPMKVVEQKYGAEARSDVVMDLIQSTYSEAVEKAGVQPAGQPKLEVTAETAGTDLEYLASIEVYPEIELQGLDKLKIERPTVDVTDADVDKLIESLRKSRRELNDVERASQQGDVCTIDFLGKIDGEAFDGGKGEDTELELGSGRFLPDMENGIVGHNAGEEFVIDVAFPEDYQAENLQGKTAQFEIKLKAVKEPKLPEIDAEFLKAHGVAEDAGEQGLKDKCRDALTKERDKAIKTKLKNQALDQLLEKNEIEVPDSLVSQEIPRLRQEAAQRFSAMKANPEQLQGMFPDELFTATARRRVALGLLIGEVIKVREIKLDKERVEQTLTGIAADYEHPEQIKQYYQGNPQLLQGLHAMVMEEQVVDSLLEGVKIKDVKVPLDELLNSQQQAQG